MDNFSFPKDARGYSQREKPVENVSNAILCEPKIVDEAKFVTLMTSSKDVVNELIAQLEETYSIKARKELYDARIHLAMVKNLLKSIK